MDSYLVHNLRYIYRCMIGSIAARLSCHLCFARTISTQAYGYGRPFAGF